MISLHYAVDIGVSAQTPVPGRCTLGDSTAGLYHFVSEDTADLPRYFGGVTVTIDSGRHTALR